MEKSGNKDRAEKLLKMARRCKEEKDYESCLAFLRESIELGGTDAIVDLGNLYANGEGVEEDLETAMEYYRQAAKLENWRGYHNIACYDEQEGRGESAIENFRKAFELSGNALPAYGLGNQLYPYDEMVKRYDYWWNLSAREAKEYPPISISSELIDEMKNCFRTAAEDKSFYAYAESAYQLADLYVLDATQVTKVASELERTLGMIDADDRDLWREAFIYNMASLNDKEEEIITELAQNLMFGTSDEKYEGCRRGIKGHYVDCFLRRHSDPNSVVLLWIINLIKSYEEHKDEPEMEGTGLFVGDLYRYLYRKWGNEEAKEEAVAAYRKEVQLGNPYAQKRIEEFDANADKWDIQEKINIKETDNEKSIEKGHEILDDLYMTLLEFDINRKAMEKEECQRKTEELEGVFENEYEKGVEYYSEAIHQKSMKAARMFGDDIRCLASFFIGEAKEKMLKSSAEVYERGISFFPFEETGVDLFNVKARVSYHRHFGHSLVQDDGMKSAYATITQIKDAENILHLPYDLLDVYGYSDLGDVFLDVKDYENALYCYIKGELEDDIEEIGMIYYANKKDYNRAKEILEIAGTPNANLVIAKMYAEGEGVKKNINKAIEKCLKVAESGESVGYRLAGIFLKENGRLVEAMQYLKKAAGMGDEEAALILNDMEMDPSRTIAQGIADRIFGFLDDVLPD